jgi:hypothetical protein
MLTGPKLRAVVNLPSDPLQSRSSLRPTKPGSPALGPTSTRGCQKARSNIWGADAIGWAILIAPVRLARKAELLS